MIEKLDRQNHGRGQYEAYAAPWSTYKLDKELRQGVDYIDRILIDPNAPQTTPANGSSIAWQWPFKRGKAGVRGYNHWSFGAGDGAVTPVKVQPVKLSDARAISTAFTGRLAIAIGEAQILSECYACVGTSKKLEMGFMAHVPPSTAAWQKNDGTQLGRLTDGVGRDWQVVHHKSGAAGAYTLATPSDERSIPYGSFEHLDLARFCRDRKLLDYSETIPGLLFGVEPITGSGLYEIARLTCVMK